MGILQKIFGEYLIFKIYGRDLTAADDISDPRFSEIEQQNINDPAYRHGYGGYQSIGFQAVEDGTLLATCWFWYGDRYKERNFWPLQDHEAKLVRIETEAEARGKGIAPKLIAYASSEMGKRGFRKLYARIWHSYSPSLRAFKKAGWQQIALVIVFSLFGHKHRYVWHLRQAKVS